MSGTALHNVVTALTATFTAALAGQSGIKVFDGRAVNPPRRHLCVGWTGEDESAADAVRREFNYAGTASLESILVACQLICWAGTQNAPAARAEATGLFDLLDAALVADRDLGGAALNARVTEFSYVPGKRPEGVLAQIRFTVTAETHA